MHEASSCTTPSAFGRPPYPTLVSSGSSSTMLTPAVSASSTSDPAVIIWKALSTQVAGPPFLKRFPLAEGMTTGLIVLVMAASACPDSLESARGSPSSASGAAAAIPAAAVVRTNARRFNVRPIRQHLPGRESLSYRDGAPSGGRQLRGRVSTAT